MARKFLSIDDANAALRVSGDDSNIDVTITPKGTGQLYVPADIHGTQGGFKQTIDGWNITDVAASQSAVAVVRAAGDFIPLTAGSVLGVQVTSNAARAAGTLTITVVIAGVATVLTAILDGTNTTQKATHLPKDKLPFNAGDAIGCTVTTDAGWLPVTADIQVSIRLEC